MKPPEETKIRQLAIAVLTTLGLLAALAAIAGPRAADNPRAGSGGINDLERTHGAQHPGFPDPRPGLLLADERWTPRLQVSWTTDQGQWKACRASLPYASASARVALCDNLDVYAALGGTRLEKGAADPAGAIVRVGFYKRDPDRLMLQNPARGAFVRIRITNVRFNQPVDPKPRSLVQHMNYSDGALQACGAPSRLADIFLTANREDDLAARIRDPRGVRPGFYSIADRITLPPASSPPQAPEVAASAVTTARVMADGTVTFEALFPYAAFRHAVATLQPPIPGEFSEPDHFHLEFEVVPAGNQAESS